MSDLVRNYIVGVAHLCEIHVFSSNISLLRHDSESMECSQRLLYVNIKNTQGMLL